MKKFLVPVVAVLLCGTVSANAQSTSQPAKPVAKATTTTAAAQKAPAQTKPATSTTTAPKPASNAVASNSNAKADTGKSKKMHHLRKKTRSDNASQPTTGKAGKAAAKPGSSKQ